MRIDAVGRDVAENDQEQGALRSLVSPVTLEEFQQSFWPDQPFVVHGDLARFGAPFNDPLLTDFPALCAHYGGRILFGRGSRGPRSVLIQNVNPHSLYEMGLALYLPDIEPIIAGSTAFLRDLERSLGLAEGDARITAWASPSAEGIACHFDAEEVFSIQLLGTKRFFVAETHALVAPVGSQYGPGIPPAPELYLQAAQGFPDPDDFKFIRIDMQPGSVLFLPRGMWHRTEADADSLSISVILSPASTADLALGALRLRLLQDPRWRRPLYGEAGDALAELLESLPRMAASVRPGDLAPRPTRLIPEMIDGATRFQRVPHAHLCLEGGGAASRVQMSFRSAREATTSRGVELSVSAAYAPVLAWLDASRAAFAVSDLLAKFPKVALPEHQVMLARLTDEAFLQWLAFEPLTD